MITTARVGCNHGRCVLCCPVDCTDEGERTWYIQPDECIEISVLGSLGRANGRRVACDHPRIALQAQSSIQALGFWRLSRDGRLMHAIVLKYFIEVASAGSVRKASERLYVAASAVNRQIHKLEDELGVELFDRMPNGLRLNAAGERLLKHAQETLHQFQVMRTELDALKGERTGHVKVASMDSFFEELLPSAVEEFLQIFPAVTYTITSTQPMEIPQLVMSGQADVGLTFVSRLPGGVESVATANLPIGVVMPPGHPLSKHASVSLKECAKYPFLRSSSHPVLSASLSAEFAAFWDDMEPAATCNSTPLLKRLIMGSKGISCFSKIAFIEELRNGDLLWRPFELPALSRLQVGILVPTQRVLPNVTQNFVARMARRLTQLEIAAAAL